MSTTLKVAFSGVLGFVKHPAKDSACVLMANALVGAFQGPGQVHDSAGRDEVLSSVDGHGLARHFGFLRIPAVHVGGDARAETVRYLHRERVRFILPGAKPGRPWNVTKVLRLADVTETSCAVDPAALGTTPPASTLAQVVLDGGHLEVTRTGGPWTILDAPGGRDHGSMFIPFEVTWTLTSDGNDPVRVEFEPLDGGARSEPLTLKDVNGDVTVHVTNVCHENPLRWTQYQQLERDDVDFRWHYELLTQAAKDEIKAVIAPGARAPRPGPHEVEFIGSGMNCMFTMYPDTPFTL